MWCNALAVAAEESAPTDIYDLDKLTPTTVSTYIRDQRTRGSTVPPKGWVGLMWAQICTRTTSPRSGSPCEGPKNLVERTACDREPMPAEMATEGELRAMEVYAVHGDTPLS